MLQGPVFQTVVRVPPVVRHKGRSGTSDNMFKKLSIIAIRYLLPFVSTYSCKAAVLNMVRIKTKFRGRMNLERDLSLNLTEIQPDIGRICSDKQSHTSH